MAPLVFPDHIDTLPAYALAQRVALDEVVLRRDPDPLCANHHYLFE